jgi:hypothetical protein
MKFGALAIRTLSKPVIAVPRLAEHLFSARFEDLASGRASESEVLY